MSMKAFCLICALALTAAPHIRLCFAETPVDSLGSKRNFLASSIYDQLAADKSVSASGLQVEAERGEVVLRGRVPSLRARQAAESCIRGRIGVRKVVNLLEIEPAAIAQDTAILAGRVDSALSVNPYLSGCTVKVAASGGTVILSGVVYSNFEREMARHAVERVAGVDSIVNRIEVAENYLAAGESGQLLTHSDPAEQELIDSYLERGIDPELSIIFKANIAAYWKDWKDSLAIEPPPPMWFNSEIGRYESFDFFGLGVNVGKYLIRKVLGREKDKDKDTDKD